MCVSLLVVNKTLTIFLGVISLDSVDKQSVTLDVMPLIGGYLPLPSVRLSKYIPADKKMSSTKTQGIILLVYFLQ